MSVPLMEDSSAFLVMNRFLNPAHVSVPQTGVDGVDGVDGKAEFRLLSLSASFHAGGCRFVFV